MLLQFKVSNFLSFNEEIIFNMLASEDTKFENHLVSSKIDIPSVLKCAALYGANASGKSNLIKSIDFSRNIIVSDQFQRSAYKPFKLEGIVNKKPSKFQFIFMKDDIIFDYGFSMNREEILDEWLYIIDGEREEEVFSRKLNSEKQYIISISNKHLRKNSKERKKFELVNETIGSKQKRQLLLTKLSSNNVKLIEPVFEWFQELKIIYPDTKYDLMELRTTKNKDFFTFLSESLELLGTGINNVSFVTQKFDLEDTFEDMPFEVQERLFDVINGLEEDSLGVLEVRNKRYIFEREENDVKVVKLMTQHQTMDGKLVSFEMSEESDGTQRLFDILPMIYDLCSNSRVYLFDELDRSLHTILTMFLLKFFLNYGEEKGSQLIFSTHDTNIMDILRDDEIWLVQKNKYHSTDIISLYEYDIDEKMEIVKGYLNGRFGGIPNIKDLKIHPNNTKKRKYISKKESIIKGDNND